MPEPSRWKSDHIAADSCCDECQQLRYMYLRYNSFKGLVMQASKAAIPLPSAALEATVRLLLVPSKLSEMLDAEEKNNALSSRSDRNFVRSM
jgi:hypothetical protein